MSISSVIGIDLGGTRIKIGKVNSDTVVTSKILDAGSNRKLTEILPTLKEEIVQLSERQKDSVRGIGLAFPGIVDSDRNCVVSTSGKYEDAISIDLVRWSKETFNLPFRMDNDARMACLGEWRYGAGKGASDVLMMTLGTGIGSSAIIEGRLLRGKHFQAGILGGHIIIDYKNKKDQCSCGKYGCVEAAASMWRIQNMAKEHPLFKESQLADTDDINWETILEFSKQGDELAGLLKRHCLDVWSVGLINLVHAYDPERVIIGGGISHSEKVILPWFERSLKEQAWCPGGLPKLYVAKFPDTAALLGVAALFA
jgi:glucokinase